MPFAGADHDEGAGSWIKDQEVVAQDGKITEYHVRMKITFVLKT